MKRNAALDGAYTFSGNRTCFHRARRPTDLELARLLDTLSRQAPVRQWVLTFPFPLRFLLAAQPEALSQMLAVVQRGISTFLIHHAGFSLHAATVC